MDDLGHQVRAEAVAVAAGPIDHEALLLFLLRQAGSGSAPRTGRPQEEWKTWAARSSVNTSSAESTNLVTPSGWEQAPRPATPAADLLATSSASIPPDPSISAASARAIDGSPSLHGPH